MSGTLFFNPKDVARLILHAVSAEDHEATWGQRLEEGARRQGTTPEDRPYNQWSQLVADAQDHDPGPHLWFVHDQGVYLMSNGRPNFPDNDPRRVIYADGLNPHTTAFDDWWQAARDIVGGDDFNDPLPIGDELVEAAQRVLNDPDADAKFFITVDESAFVFGFDLLAASP